MTEQTSMEVEDGAEDVKRYRKYQHDCTPYPVIHQGLEWLHDLYPDLGSPGFVHVDQCSGAAPFSVMSRELFGGKTHAFEIRKEELADMERNADTATICDSTKHGLPVADLYSTNIAFSLLPEMLENALDSAKVGSLVMYLGLSEWGQRGTEANKMFDATPPIAQARICGAISFRGPQINPDTGKKYGSDMRSYSWWVWLADGKGGSRWGGLNEGAPLWTCQNLDRLPGHDRKWTVRPGTEWTNE